MIDTHTHYAHTQFDEDRKEMLKKAYDNVFLSIGIHPCRITEEDCKNTEERLESLQIYADWPETVAVGETGLDYYRETDERKYKESVS